MTTVAATAAAVRAGTETAVDRVERALAEIATHGVSLNAFTAVFSERARATARRIDAIVAAGGDPGSLAGVPFAAKDLFDVRGVVTRAGAKVTATDPPAERDAALIERWESAGAVLVGVTTMDEFAYGFVTENAHDGATANPHDRGRIAGGSSGGSAAAVGAALVPLALGSDTNGSIRVPAALCGIFGLRPTFGTLTSEGAYPFAASLDTVGPFARTAADLIAGYTALAPLRHGEAGGLAGVRAARLGGWFQRGLVPEARAAVGRVGDALGARATIELAGAERARAAAFLITAAEAGERHVDRLRTRAAEYDPATRDRLAAGALVPARWYVRAQRYRSAFVTELAELFAQVDVLIAPATPYGATPIGRRTIVVDGAEIEIRPNLGVFTQPVSLAGVPVVTVPVVLPGALPQGVQLIAAPYREPLLLALAEDLERRGVVGAGPVPAAT